MRSKKALGSFRDLGKGSEVRPSVALPAECLSCPLCLLLPTAKVVSSSVFHQLSCMMKISVQLIRHGGPPVYQLLALVKRRQKE